MGGKQFWRESVNSKNTLMKKIAIVLCTLALPMFLAAQSTVKNDQGQEVVVQEVQPSVEVTPSTGTTFEAGVSKTDNPDANKPNTYSKKYQCGSKASWSTAKSCSSAAKACCKEGAAKACCLSKQSQKGAGAKAAQVVVQ